MYKPNDFNLTNAPEEMVQYVIDNVEDFEPRYKRALNIMDRKRCSLRNADFELYDNILDACVDWFNENGDGGAIGYDIEEIFG